MKRTTGSFTIDAFAKRVLGITFSAASWAAWIIILKAAFALPLNAEEFEILCRLTRRTRQPARQVRELWCVVGRRAGKSIIAALIAVFKTTCCSYTLAPGERGVFMIIAADRRQARVCKRYVSGLLALVQPLANLVVRETAETIELANGLMIEIHTASFRTLRGYTSIGVVCDEIAFWPTDDSANPDSEILAAIRPAMATVPEAMLVVISSPYARRGEMWKVHRTYFGQDRDDILVVQADTRTMNPTIPVAVIEHAYEQDEASARAEFGAEFRSDVETFVSREAVDAVVVPGCYELAPEGEECAFVDVAGGSGGDSATLAVARKVGERSVLCLLRERRPPFSPEAVITEFAATLKQRGILRVVGDKYAGEFPREAFLKHGVAYEPSALPKSDLYRELLPALNSGRVELLDEPRLIAQLLGLERRVARGGRDSIDHAPGGHDDVINAAAGALIAAVGRACAMNEAERVRCLNAGAMAKAGAEPDPEEEEHDDWSGEVTGLPWSRRSEMF